MALEKMTPNALRDWQAQMGYTWAQAFEALGVGETTYAAWLRGERAIGKHVALACAALAAGLKPLGEKS